MRRRADWLPASVVGPLLGVSRRDDPWSAATGGPATRETASGQAERLESADR